MSEQPTTVDATQSSKEEIQAGDMSAIREAIKAQLEPAQEATEETVPHVEPEVAAAALATEEAPVEPEPEKESNSDDPQWKQNMRHRYDKLTSQKRELEEQVQLLKEQKYESRKAESPADTSISNLIDKANTIQDLERLDEDAFEAERWAKRALSRYRRDPEAVEKEIERKAGELPEDVEVWLEDLALNAEFSRESDIPKRKKQLVQQQQSFGIAAGKYPWLNDPTSPARAWVEDVKESHPGIKSLPDVDLYLARALVGFAIEQEQAKPKTAKQTHQPTKQPGRPSAAVSTDDLQSRMIESKKNAMKSGSKDGLRDFIKLHLEQK